MRMHLLPFIALAAMLANASPIRIIIATSHQEVSTNGEGGVPLLPPPVAFHFGHAIDAANAGNIPSMQAMASKPLRKGKACTDKMMMKHSSMNDKAVEASNALRKMFGFPEIIIPMHPNASASPVPPMMSVASETLNGMVIERPHTHHHHMSPHHDQSFLRRIHHSLMALGTWEARVVAFVLGCGIGVLLRMLWVIAIVSYRTVRGDTFEDDENAQYALLYEAPEEEIVVAPPQYILVDEKAPVVIESTKPTTTDA